jgi:hypothetical protein
MRTLTDTSNSFTWKNGAPFAIGDFNGDGATDYWMFKGGILAGRGYGLTPDTNFIPSISLPYGVGIYDINKDGKDDIIIQNENTSNGIAATIGLGASDLKNIKYIPLTVPERNPVHFGDASGISCTLKKIYKKGNENRVVWLEVSNYRTLNEHIIFNIGRIQVEGDTAHMIRINTYEIDKAGSGESGGGYVYYNRRTEEATFLMVGGVPGSGLRNQGIRVFSLDRDTLDFVKHYTSLWARVFLFDEQHGEPYNEGWAAVGDIVDTITRTVSYVCLTHHLEMQ